MRIAILLTCFNRKQFTIKCLESVELALKQQIIKASYSIYLTDDGSSDGTAAAVSKLFPKVIILKGNGNLFWAGGMKNSWFKALERNYDGYLLLNDDTIIFEYFFLQLENGINDCYSIYKKNGILIGSTKDKQSNNLTYGGSVYLNKFKATYRNLYPNGSYQECQLGNGNIMFVHKDVVEKIGILSKDYIHGVADYDYTYRSHKNGIPVLVLPYFSGYCSPNILNKNIFFLSLKTINKRYKYLYSPIGLAFNDNLVFQKAFFKERLLLVFIVAHFKVLFPNIYIWLNNFFRKSNKNIDHN